MKRTSVSWLVLMQFVLAFEWLHSGWGKWSGPGFMANIGKTLDGFIAKNPHPQYVSFLQNHAVPNAQMFGNLIRTSELAVGLALLLGGLLLLSKKSLHPIASWLLIIALVGAALMNFNFYLASGWLSPSGAGINLTMGLFELILAIFYITNRRHLATR